MTSPGTVGQGCGASLVTRALTYGSSARSRVFPHPIAPAAFAQPQRTSTGDGPDCQLCRVLPRESRRTTANSVRPEYPSHSM